VRRRQRRVSLVLAAAAAARLVAACGGGGQDEQADPVAHAVAPPPLPHAKRTRATATPAPSAAPRPKAKPLPRAILSPADLASFARLDASLAGTQGLAVSGVGLGLKVQRTGSLAAGVAWSTSKVPIAMAVYAAGLGSAQQGNLTAAITESDNAAALRLWSVLGGGTTAAVAADVQLRAAGDEATQVESRALSGPAYTPFGQTSWALADQARFTAGMACLDAGAQVLGLMGRVDRGQRWGLGSVGVPAQLKGGWGPGSEPGVGGGYLDRQLGVISVHGKPLAVAIASRPADGSHETGTRDLTTLADWLVAHADVRALPSRARCA
jgi:hypothetical protein